MRKLIIPGMAAFAIAAPLALAAPTSHAKYWENKASTAVCGKLIGRSSFHLLCSAKGIPRPKNGGNTGDPFVILRRTGRPRLVLVSQDEFPPGNPSKLANGTTWNKNGITCLVNHKVTCTNKSGHGFTIGNGKYKPF